MRATLPTVILVASTFGGAAWAQTADAPASPSGAPAAAAQHGSSMTGPKGSKNEMAAHKKNEKKQNMMANPRK